MLGLNNYFNYLAIIIFFGCQQSKEMIVAIEPKKAHNKSVYRIDTIRFQSNHNHGYYKSANMGITHDGEYLCLLDNNRDLFLFNLFDTNVFFKKIPSLFIIASDIKGTCFHSLDSIFVIYENEILILDTSGTIKVKINFISLDPFLNNYNLESNSLNEITPYFDNSKKILYLGIRSKNSYQWTITHPFEIALNLRTMNVGYCEINYPERFHYNTYGWLESPIRAYNNALHFYSFPPEPNLYGYNLQTKEKKVIGGKSSFQNVESKVLTRGTKRKNIIKYNTYEDNNKNRIESCYYGSFIFDPYSKKYYRLFYLPLPTKLDSFRYNTINEKKVKLMVFNENFELEDEIDFDVDNLSNFYPSKIGLIFTIPNRQIKNTANEANKFSLKVYKFN